MSKENENYKITKHLTEKKLREICNFFKNRKLQEFELIENEQKIILKAAPEHSPVAIGSPVGDVPMVDFLQSGPGSQPSGMSNSPTVNSGGSTEEQLDGNVVAAPISGTFYTSPSPNDPPYIQVGDKVSKGDKLCIVEAMKVMNEIESPHSGQVIAIPATNGKPIKQGETMVVIK